MSTGSRMTGQRSTGTRRARGQEPANVDAGGWEPRSTPPPPGGGGGGSGGGWEPWRTDVTVAEHDVLDCSICYTPLKSPIFQCPVGHVVCSRCSDKLKNERKCHLCRVAMPRGYQRCHAMERVMDSVRGPCLHARYGCSAMPAYYAREEHVKQCTYAPCHCLGDACNFVGPLALLISHIMEAHDWPCSTEVRPEESFRVNLRNGFNFLIAVRGSAQYLLLLNMANTPFGKTISAVRVVGSCAATAICNLELSFTDYKDGSSNGHYQTSRFEVECKRPLEGLPDPIISFQFLVPKYSNHRSHEESASVHVTAKIIITNGNQINHRRQGRALN